MLDANEEWTKVMFDIRLMPLAKQGEEFQRFREIQKKSASFMKKLGLFNLTARKELESMFDDDDIYFSRMDEKYSHAIKFYEELELKLNQAP